MMERIDPEVASMKSVNEDGSDTSIFLKPSAMFYEVNFVKDVWYMILYWNHLHSRLPALHVQSLCHISSFGQLACDAGEGAGSLKSKFNVDSSVFSSCLLQLFNAVEL